MTPMERHAALGPIAWTAGGMRATTRDGYAAEIVQAEDDAGAQWTVRVLVPPGHHEDLVSVGFPAADLREARATVAVEIGRFRDAERRWWAEAAILMGVARRVMDMADRELTMW